MESYKLNENYNSMENIEIYEKLTNLDYLIPPPCYFYLRIEVLKNNDKKGSIKKPIILKVYEQYKNLPYEEKEIFINYHKKLEEKYNRKTYEINYDTDEKFFQSYNYIRKTNDFCNVIKTAIRKDICFDCWLRKNMCMCNKVIKKTFSYKIYLIFHYEELLCSSNTGKILKLIDNNTELIIFGLEENETKLKKLFEDEDIKKNSVCLFPSKDSIFAKEYYNLNKKKEKEIGGVDEIKDINDVKDIKDIKDLDLQLNENSNLNFQRNIFVIDGTWPQAISMMQIIPKEITRVKIIPQQKNIYNSLRNRYSEDTCSTLEAVAILLSDLGEKEENINDIYNGLVKLVEINLEKKKPYVIEQFLGTNNIEQFEGFMENELNK
jgi:DTW domain-containing protein YfiP